MKLSDSELEQIRQLNKIIRDPTIKEALRIQYQNRNLIKQAIGIVHPHQQSIKHLLNSTGASSLLENITKAIPQGSLLEQTYQAIKTVELMKSHIDDATLNQINNIHNVIDTNILLENSLLLDSHVLKGIEGYLINIPLDNIEKPLTEFKKLSINIDEFKSYRNKSNEYLFRATTSETTSIGNVQLKTVQQTQFQIQELKQDFEDFKNNIMEDSNKKDEMLEELLAYFKNGGSDIVKVKKLSYNSKNAELVINDRKINLRADSNQHYLCKVIFENEISVKKVWEIDDIVQAIGEYLFTERNWKSRIYNTIRHLNDKIQSQTGISKFIIYDNKTIIVNPKYLEVN